ncbi:TetR/AcrR family transcriptional regulator [Massilia sp.]|uniref:TetR/AcrR family transcriptional regulator n=1 Tax=Massilia sp. TaxID=1882437 RepID=UPI00391878C3
MDIPVTDSARRRGKLESAIIQAATRLFAECGFDGTSIAAVAERTGISKQNLLYYFPTKNGLYQRVLDDVLDDWLARMAHLAEAGGEPADVLRAYIGAKLRFSREQPWASRVYAMEVIGGAKFYGEQIRARVVPLLRRDIEVFERWMADGRIARLDATHLLFALWAMTQSYADFSAQMALVLDKPELSGADFEDAERLIGDMVVRAVAAKG